MESQTFNKKLNFDKVFIDYIAGTISGQVSVVILYPLDIVKTTMQVNIKNYSSIIYCTKDIYKTSGFLGFYKGMLSPLIGSSLISPIYYGSNETIKKLINKCTNSQYMRNNLPLKYVFLSGSFAGLCADFISIPLEHIKIKIQTQTSFKYKGSIDCFVSIAKNHGFLKLYTGSQLQFLRDFIGCGSYFLMYDVSKRYFISANNDNQITHFELFLSGCSAGLAYWPLAYPIDVIKNKIQSDCLQNPKYLSYKSCILETYQLNGKGVGNFYRGFSISNIRSIPSAALALFTFENLSLYLGKCYNRD